MQYEANWTSVVLGFCIAMGMVWLGSLTIETPQLSSKQNYTVHVASR